MTATTPGSPKQPRVSVVIPCYNGGRFLREAIESVLHQTCRAAEIVVVNDGSTDDTAAVARSFDQVRYIEQRNQGAPAARNTGMRSSTGDFLVFLDADDRLQPHALATGVESLAANPEWAFVSGEVRVIDEDGSPRCVPAHRPRARGSVHPAVAVQLHLDAGRRHVPAGNPAGGGWLRHLGRRLRGLRAQCPHRQALSDRSAPPGGPRLSSASVQHEQLTCATC